jgi:hypothetical protein
MHPNKALIDFPIWVAKFESFTAGRDALARLEKEFRFNNAEPVSFFGNSLRSVVLRACFCAFHFTKNNDPDEKRRHANSAALKQLKGQRAALRRLKNFFATHEFAAMITIVNADVDLKRDGIHISETNQRYRLLTARYVRILDALETRLCEHRSFGACGPYRDDNTYGCLVFDQPLGTAKRKALAIEERQRTSTRSSARPGPKTLLLFDLVQSFKLASEGKSRRYKDRMPEIGEPHYPLAVDFLKATFGSPKSITTKQAKRPLLKFLTNNRTAVAYCDWPVVREVNERLSELEGV